MALITNMDNEVRDGYLVSSEMKKIWQKQLEMVVKILDVCKKHELKIWAFGGTLLGAVRHHGYIPWDDDIDLIMFREDFEILERLPQSEFQPYFLQTPLTEPGYIHPHGQLRNSNTAAILPIDVNQRFNQGIFIDIMVLDKIPADIELTYRLLEKRDAARLELFLRNYNPTLFTSNVRSILNTLRRYIRFKRSGLYNMYCRAEDIVLKANTSTSDKVCSSLTNTRNYRRMIFDRSWYAETIHVPFENIHIPVPACYDECLRKQYGDYTTPKNIPTCHGNVIFDTEHSYRDILPEYRNRRNITFGDKVRSYFTLKPANN